MFYVYLYFPIIFLCRLVYMIEITGTKYKKRVRIFSRTGSTALNFNWVEIKISLF